MTRMISDEQLRKCVGLSGCDLLKCIQKPHKCWQPEDNGVNPAVGGRELSEPSQTSVAQKSNAEILWNFSKALVQWTAAGMPVRTQEQVTEIYKICSACEFLKNNVCQKCGCQCDAKNILLNKLTIATEKCPVGKWS